MLCFNIVLFRPSYLNYLHFGDIKFNNLINLSKCELRRICSSRGVGAKQEREGGLPPWAAARGDSILHLQLKVCLSYGHFVFYQKFAKSNFLSFLDP